MNNNLFEYKPKKRYNPDDKFQYIIPKKAITYTETILREYAKFDPPHEGFVYWGGQKDESSFIIRAVIAPNTDSESLRVSTSHDSNYHFVQSLIKNGLIHIAQVHSHPRDWVDHSYGDDLYAAFKVNGLLSIVVPEYCQNGMLPLENCGIHRFDNSKFIRLANPYVNCRFQIVDDLDCIFEDLR